MDLVVANCSTQTKREKKNTFSCFLSLSHFGQKREKKVCQKFMRAHPFLRYAGLPKFSWYNVPKQ
jgi:hypothetical protein